MASLSGWIWLAVGGALGTLARFILVSVVNGAMGRLFPYGTLSVNLIGSLLMGIAFVVIGQRAAAPELWRLLIMTGFMGGFTTFSAFSLETMLLLQEGALVRALLNAVVSVVGSVALLGVGMGLARGLLR